MPANPRTRPAVRRCAGAGAVALTLLGAGLPPAAAAGGGEPDLTRFYRQKARWAVCKDVELPKDMQCAEVTVPLDYARPAEGTIDLALSRYRATGKSRGSVLLNFGGPGGSGVSQLGLAGKDFMSLTNGYDVVGFDPRGVGRSSPVSCGEGTGGAADDAGSTDDGSTDDIPDAGRPQALLKALKQLTVRCAAHSGPVLSHIGTVNASRDLDVIRQALGDEKLNYLGFSYGTRLGAVYAAQFPDKVGRMALDGVDTLTESAAEQGMAGARGQQTALDDFLDWCVTDVACPFGQDRRKAGDAVVRLVRSLDGHPVLSDFGGPFSGQDLVGALGQGLYGKELWPRLERALASLIEDGDTRGVQNFASGGYAVPLGPPRHGGLVGSADIPADNLSAALMAINCADDPDRPSAEQLTRDVARLDEAYQRASPVFGRFRLTQVMLCYGRPRGTDFIRDKVKDVDSARMLLVGTRGDPATPYAWTIETAKRLGPSAVVLDNRGDGHTGYSSSRCVHGKVDDFLLYGTLPADGSSCPADDDRGAVTDSPD
ncbi:tripeptidyl-peptidase B [Streptomyces sp. Ag109_O5-1]|uniref:alpha/beta hydrolase n=1 Tax=Streptomyces sp. Ag109_O5-1 TaxID=1938851 RepID=UPI000F4FC8C2|nr:alpha/beta hydrolase [Streptomyces sp. Ag109_O5-1]RPE37706.1 tripeptidyl-peptidase B [Streptomyces sp. Ag109_O5-1]